MKKLLTILFLFISVSGIAQFDQKQTMGTSKTDVKSKGLFSADSGMVITNVLDTTTANRGYIKTIPGAHIKTSDNKEFYRNTTATAWIYIPDFIRVKSTINDSLNTLNMSLENGGPPGFDIFRQKNDSTIQGRSIYFPFGLIGDTTSFGDSIFAIKPDTAWFSSLYIRRADSSGFYITPKRLSDTAAAIRAAIGAGGITVLSPWPYNINGAQHRLDSVKALLIGVAGTGVTENLMPNSEDQDNTTYWDNDGNVTITANAAVDFTGGTTMDQLNITNASGNVQRTTNGHPVVVVTGDTYYLTMDVKRGTLSSGVYCVRDVDNAADIIFTTLTIPAGATSVFTSPSFVVPAGCTHIYIYTARDVASTGTYFIGRVQVHHLGNTYIHTTTAPSPAAGSGGFLTAISTDSVNAFVAIGKDAANYGLDIGQVTNFDSSIQFKDNLILRVNGNASARIYNQFVSNVTSFGYRALLNTDTTKINSAFGFDALKALTSGDGNEAYGYRVATHLTSGGGNTAVGHDALGTAITSSQSVAVGYDALFNNTASFNTAVGYAAGTSNSTGSKNVFLGNFSNSTSAISNSMALGTNSLIKRDSAISIGDSVAVLYAGFGTAYPTEKLDVRGNVRFSGALMPNNAAGTSGNFLQSAGAGSPPIWTSTVTATAVPLSGITAMTADNFSMNNGTYEFAANWNSLAGNNAFSLYGNSTAAAGNVQRLLYASLYGANANSNQTTTTATFDNHHTGTGSVNVAARFTAQSGSTNIAFYTGGGNAGFGTNLPTALVHIAAGTAAAGTAPLKFTSGTVMTTPEAGALEYNSGLLMLDSSNSQRDTIATRKWARNNISGGGASSQWTTLSSDIYYNTGNVGIGSASAPTDKLHLRGASSNGLTVEGSQPMLTLNATSNDPQITLTRAGNSSNMYVNSSAQLIIQGYNEVKIGQSGVTGSTTFTYTSGSFLAAVGIGAITSPTARLHLPAGTATAATAPEKLTTGTLLTTAEVGAREYNNSFYDTKNSGLRYGLGGVIYDAYADVSNSGTSETDLDTYTTPASTLATDGEKLYFNYTVNLTDITATAAIKVYFGGTAIASTGALTVSATGALIVTGWLVRTSSTTVRASVNISSPTASTAVYTAETDITGLTLSNTNILKITGTAGGAGGGTGDIVFKLGSIEWKSKANN